VNAVLLTPETTFIAHLIHILSVFGLHLRLSCKTEKRFFNKNSQWPYYKVIRHPPSFILKENRNLSPSTEQRIMTKILN
jgi:hypothetical protein